MSDRPITLHGYEEAASRVMDPVEFHEVESAPPGNQTARRTRAAWDALALRPRLMPAAPGPDLSVSVLGQRLALPVMLAPAGYHTRAHPDGELASARAASAAGSLLVVSANPGHPADRVAAAAPGPKWLQTYVFRDRAETAARVKAAERDGYRAICVTLDAHWPAKREWRGRVSDPQKTWADPAATWDDVARVRDLTSLPLVCKGVMNGEDAARCVEAGASAMIVSNHGSRLDGTLATVEVLPEVVGAVADRAEVYVDGGIRRGTDVVKALALGARATLIGRPLFWGLACAGEQGVRDVLDILREEIEVTMMLSGRPTIASIDASLVSRMPDLPPRSERP